PLISILFPYTTLFRSQIDAVSNIKLDGSSTWGGDSSLDSKVNGSYTRKNAMTGTRMSSGGQRTLESAIMEMRQIRVNFEAQNLRSEEHTSELQSRFDL